MDRYLGLGYYGSRQFPSSPFFDDRYIPGRRTPMSYSRPELNWGKRFLDDDDLDEPVKPEPVKSREGPAWISSYVTERPSALDVFNQTTEEYDEALIQRARRARTAKPTNVRPWRLRIPKFVPASELRPPKQKPEVRLYKPRPIRVDDQVRINYHIELAKGKREVAEKK